jgi:Fe-S cluster biogenesis protein NfuA
MAQYQHDKAWQIEDHGSFVHLRSTVSARTIEIYANKFTEDEQGSTDIDDVLRQRRVTPSVIVHRGHSTYVAQTIEKVPETAALVYLGNCGGYALLETILKKAPKAHILTTKGIGTLTINDPLLKALNDYLLRGKDMTWQSFWRQAEATLGRNPRFMDYVPPDKNAGAVFLTAYRSFMTTK